VGAVVLLWPRDLFTPQEFAKLHAARLRAAATSITAGLATG
jgi:hypothetical protein